MLLYSLQPKLNCSIPTTLMKAQKVKEWMQAPIAIYDVTGGQKREEKGFGYLRPQYVLDLNYPKTKPPNKFKHAQDQEAKKTKEKLPKIIIKDEPYSNNGLDQALGITQINLKMSQNLPPETQRKVVPKKDQPNQDLRIEVFATDDNDSYQFNLQSREQTVKRISITSPRKMNFKELKDEGLD